MSRSRCKHPFGGTSTAGSEKQWKKKCHRILRRKQQVALIRGDDPATFPRKPRDVVNQYDGPKDGKCMFDVSNPRERAALRK